MSVGAQCLDLGGIAVGYAVDRAVSMLRHEGIEAAFVNHSGDAFALGVPPGEKGWEVVIHDPINPSLPLQRWLQMPWQPHHSVWEQRKRIDC